MYDNTDPLDMFICMDLLCRGGLPLYEKVSLMAALAINDVTGIKQVRGLYELRPKGMDTRECLSFVLKSLGLILEEKSNPYVVNSTFPLNLTSHPELIGEYHYLSNIGDKLRNMESFPGEKGWHFIQLYSWGKCLNRKKKEKEKEKENGNKEVRNISVSILTSTSTLVSTPTPTLDTLDMYSISKNEVKSVKSSRKKTSKKLPVLS